MVAGNVEANLSKGLSPSQAVLKRGFDVMGAAVGLALTFWLIVPAWLAASLDARSNGFFTQRRVGKDGRLFTVVKIKTMRPSRELTTTVTRSGDPRITPLGRFFRRTKIDELPQLWNVLAGDMSFVGPRPDVPGFADALQGAERVMLSIRPGITGPATLKYRNEEELLAVQTDPEAYNREVIWPDKVQMNLEYIRYWSLGRDIRYILDTVFH
ncbi:sugar transferase [Halomonas sp. 25-S5]|uniref:sugar transferase n=1 Tax=Halomonas sp. 25-S5 TaxID=2994065 RepID=UPI0024692DD9|nr:sugar transferase [Halomonas sp. 25-S5]